MSNEVALTKPFSVNKLSRKDREMEKLAEYRQTKLMRELAQFNQLSKEFPILFSPERVNQIREKKKSLLPPSIKSLVQVIEVSDPEEPIENNENYKYHINLSTPKTQKYSIYLSSPSKSPRVGSKTHHKQCRHERSKSEMPCMSKSLNSRWTLQSPSSSPSSQQLQRQLSPRRPKLIRKALTPLRPQGFQRHHHNNTALVYPQTEHSYCDNVSGTVRVDNTAMQQQQQEITITNTDNDNNNNDSNHVNTLCTLLLPITSTLCVAKPHSDDCTSAMSQSEPSITIVTVSTTDTNIILSSDDNVCVSASPPSADDTTQIISTQIAPRRLSHNFRPFSCSPTSSSSNSNQEWVEEAEADEDDCTNNGNDNTTSNSNGNTTSTSSGNGGVSQFEMERYGCDDAGYERHVSHLDQGLLRGKLRLTMRMWDIHYGSSSGNSTNNNSSKNNSNSHNYGKGDDICGSSTNNKGKDDANQNQNSSSNKDHKDNNNRYVSFSLEITVLPDIAHVKTIYRRYSDFERLYSDLERGGVVVGVFPQKQWLPLLFNRWCDECFLFRRQGELQQWLDTLLSLSSHPSCLFVRWTLLRFLTEEM